MEPLTLIICIGIIVSTAFNDRPVSKEIKEEIRQEKEK